MLHKELSLKLFYHTTFLIVLYEGVVLLCRTFRKRLKPVRVVCDTILLCPLLHASGNGISNRAVEWHTVVNDVHHLVVNLRWQILIHLLTIEDILSEILRRALFRHFHFYRFFLRCRRNCEKSEVCHFLRFVFRMPPHKKNVCCAGRRIC